MKLLSEKSVFKGQLAYLLNGKTPACFLSTTPKMLAARFTYSLPWFCPCSQIGSWRIHPWAIRSSRQKSKKCPQWNIPHISYGEVQKLTNCPPFHAEKRSLVGFVCLFVCFNAGNWTQGLMHVVQMLYNWAISPAQQFTFLMWLFKSLKLHVVHIVFLLDCDASGRLLREMNSIFTLDLVHSFKCLQCIRHFVSDFWEEV